MRYSSSLVALAAATFSLAQQSSGDIPDYKSVLDMTVDPDYVDEADRWSWCNAQYNTCRTLCDGDTENNDCEQSDLSYDCKCKSNSSAPGLQYYTQTMPTFICKATFEKCIEDHSTQKDHDLCESNINEKCSTHDPPAPEEANEDNSSETETKTDSETSSTTTEASSETSTGSADDEEVTSGTSDGFAAPTMAPGGNVAAVAALGVLAYLV